MEGINCTLKERYNHTSLKLHPVTSFFRKMFMSVFLFLCGLTFSSTVIAQCANLFNVTTTRTYDLASDKTTYIFAVTNVGAKNALSHFGITYDFCPGQQPVFLNGAVISYSVNGTNYTSLGTPNYEVDPSQDCYTGPVLKFDFGQGGIGTTTYYKLLVNGAWMGNFSTVVYKYGRNCCTQPFPGTRVCLAEPGPPILICPPGVLQLACNQALPAPNPASIPVTVECPEGILSVTFIGDVLTSTVGCVQTWTRTYQATDRCGGIALCTQTITRTVDNIKPTITLTPASTVPLPCNPTTAQIAAVFGTASVTDNCSTGLTATGSTGGETGTGCTRTVTRTWTVTDACGNTQTASQSVSFTRDTQAPVITFAATGSIPCNPTTAQIAAAFGGASVADNCSTGLTATGTVGAATGTGCTRTVVKSWTVTDACGNIGTNTQSVTYSFDQAAPVITLTAATALGCNPTTAQIAAAFGGASVADNCSTGLTATGTVGAATGTGCTRTVVKSWTVTDACGNIGTNTQSVTYSFDQTAPVITLTAATALGCNPTTAQIAAAFGGASVADNCSTGLTATGVVGAATGTGCTRTVVKSWTVTDACGNIGTASQSVTYNFDQTAPVITVTPSTALACNPTTAQIAAAFGTAQVSDNCTASGPLPGNPCVSSYKGNNGGGNCPDLAGSPATGTVTLTFTAPLTAAPTVINISDQFGTPSLSTVRFGPGQLSADGLSATYCYYDGPNNNNNLWGGGIVLTFNLQYANGLGCVPQGGATDLTPVITTGPETGTGCIRTVTRTWTSVDACGNTGTTTQTVTFTRDTQAPVITLSAATALGCNPTTAQIAAAFGGASVADNCSTGLTATGTVGAATGTGCTRTVVKSWTVTDACGNIGTNTQSVTYSFDQTAPVITLTAATALGCNPTTAQIAAAFGGASVADNCSTGLTATGTVGAATGTGCTRTVVKSWTVTDACGNIGTNTQSVTYNFDQTAPVITLTAATALGCNPTTAQIAAAFGGATASDNCSTGLTATGVVGSESGSGCSFSTTKTWTVTDNCGNTQTATQTVTYTRDVVKPTIVVTTAGTLNCNPTEAQVLAAFGTATGSDNCGAATLTVVTGPEVGQFCNRSRTRTWTATDACGNTQTTSQTVNYLVDLTKPTFTSCPAGSNLGCNPTSFPAAGTPTAFDNCGDVVTITAGALGAPVNTQGCTWTRTRVYTATDACGNTETCTQVYTYTIDVTKPTIIVATAGTLPCNPTTAQIAAAFGGATASDNCSTGLTATGVVGSESGSGCSFSTTKTWTVTDNCGNTQTATQTVTYTRDVVKPTILVATAGSLSCNPTTAQIAAAFGGATASDNCSTGLTATGVVGSESGSGCSFSTTKTWTVTDNCGNTQTATQTVTYTRDVVKPTIVVATAGTLACNPTTAQIAAAFGGATASDNCSTGLTATGVVGSETGSGCSFSTTKTWTVTDNCGNTQTATQTVTYTRDVTKPTIVVATAGSLACNPTTAQIAAAFGGATASDNCSTGLTATGVVGSETGSGCSFSTTKTWTVTDNCGNTQTATQTVTYTRDVVKPTILVATAGTLSCNPTTAQIAAAFGGATASDNCSTGLTATGVVGSETGSGCSFSTTKTWTVTDNCGNTQTVTQTVSYTRDLTKPTVSNNAPATIEAICTASFSTLPWSAPVFTDNCGAVTLVSDVTTPGQEITVCPKVYVRVWTVRDACGNTASFTQTITVPCCEGCSPGFWKNHTELWDQLADYPVAQMPAGLKFTTTTNFNTYFNLPAGTNGFDNNLTMHGAISQGGGDCKAFARHAVAALLSSASGLNIGYPTGTSNFTSLYNAIRTALLSGNCSGTLFSQLEAISDGDHTNCGQFDPIITMNGVVNPDPQVTVSAYPNPYTDRIVFTIKSAITGSASLELYSLLGQKVTTVYQGSIEQNTVRTLIYEVPSAQRKTMVYRLRIGKETVTGTVIAPN